MTPETIYLPIVIEHYRRAIDIFIRVPDKSVHSFLQLLEMVDKSALPSLTIVDTDCFYKVMVGISPNLTRGIRGKAKYGVTSTEISISNDEMSYWLSFFEDYVRNGFGKVSHFDVEISPEMTNVNKEVTIVISVEKASPPLSREEGLRLLGL